MPVMVQETAKPGSKGIRPPNQCPNWTIGKDGCGDGINLTGALNRAPSESFTLTKRCNVYKILLILLGKPAQLMPGTYDSHYSAEAIAKRLLEGEKPGSRAEVVRTVSWLDVGPYGIDVGH